MSLNPHLGLLCVLILTACSSTPDGPDTQPAGFVVGDEPDAVRAAASILAEPGSAADAATAMYFALAVTYPIAAGLGGGGLCTVYDPSSGRSEAFSFLPRAPAAGGAFAMPGNVAGFAALQNGFTRIETEEAGFELCLLSESAFSAFIGGHSSLLLDFGPGDDEGAAAVSGRDRHGPLVLERLPSRLPPRLHGSRGRSAH